MPAPPALTALTAHGATPSPSGVLRGPAGRETRKRWFPVLRKHLDVHTLSLGLPLVGRPRDLGGLTGLLTSHGDDSPPELTGGAGGVRVEATPQGSRGRNSVRLYFQSPTLSMPTLAIRSDRRSV